MSATHQLDCPACGVPLTVTVDGDTVALAVTAPPVPVPVVVTADEAAATLRTFLADCGTDLAKLDASDTETVAPLEAELAAAIAAVDVLHPASSAHPF